MSDELNKSAEFTGKHQDEENPLLVAQRYLNIFRQIHIFNKKRQDEFDNSLLKMSSDIRILLSTLPGGSLLLEHISELEEKKGIIPDALLDSKIASSKDVPLDEKISSSFKSNSKGTDNVALSNHLIKILQQSEEKHAKDLQALTDAFLKSQENMTDILRQALNIKPSKEFSSEEKDKEKDRDKDKDKEKEREKDKTKKAPKPQVKEKQAEEIKENTPEKEQSTDDTSRTETTSKFLSFTKKLFRGHGAKNDDSDISEEDVSPLIDNTPVSLDEVDSTPVSLDPPETKPVSLDTPTSEKAKTSDDSQSLNDDWEWEYVSEDEPENPTDDDEWEYVEEDENAAPDNEQWEYVEENENASPSNEQWEYVEEPDNTPSDTGEYVEDNQNMLLEDTQYADGNADTFTDEQNWQYMDENTNTFADDENWEYNTDPNADYAAAYPAADNNEQWEYVENQDVQEDASDEQSNLSVQE